MAINDRTTETPGHKRYEELAEEIARQIAANVLRPGDRLPSIRQTCRTHHLSPSTVFQAYDLLENRGLIRAAPRSGYFVNPPPSAQAPEPAMSTPPEGAYPIEITDLVYEILSSVKSRKIVSLGSAIPSPLLFEPTEIEIPRIAGDELALRWRLDPKEPVFIRKLTQIALLNPNGSVQAPT